MKLAQRTWLTPVVAALAISLFGAPDSAQAEDTDAHFNLPFQRLSVGASIGGMGLAAGSLSLGFDPYSQLELEVAGRLLTGTQEKQDPDTGFPDYDPACSADDDVYPCAASGAMFSLGLILGKHNTWETLNKGVALRTGVSTLGEVYTSVGGRLEGAITENHKVTWNGELSLGYWFNEPKRAPSDLLALAWNGQNDNLLDTLSQQWILALRLGIQFYPIR